MNIAQKNGWKEGHEFLEAIAKQKDGTSKVAESLFDELDAEEKKKQAAKDKKRR